MKRLLVQVMASFSGYQTKTGRQRDGKVRFQDVPIIYGSMSRAVGYLAGPTAMDNTTNYLPIMSLYMTGLTQKADWRLNPQHAEKYSYVERARTPDGKLLIDQPGKRKTIERFMPVPYDMSIALSIWASNDDQGYQLVEQIATIFNPAIDIQLSNSPADWTFLTHLEFDGNVEMERVIPSGTDLDSMHLFRMNFNTVIWMSPPAKVYDTKQIYEVHVPILELEEGLDFDSFVQLDGLVIKADENDQLLFETLGPESTAGDI